MSVFPPCFSVVPPSNYRPPNHPFHLYSPPLSCALSLVITNPEDPNFDLEKLIAKWESESK